MNVVILVFAYLLFQMCLVWIIYRILKNPSVVDTSWSIGLMVSGLIYLWSIPLTPRTILISALLILWAFRLGGYLLYTRILQGHRDKRYSELAHHWKINQALGFFLNFQLQGLLIFIISLIFLLISNSNHTTLNLADAIAMVLVIIGIVGETLADLQLSQFKRMQKGCLCNTGLWRYSRHPNYFFDWLTWLGFTVFAFQAPKGYLGTLPLITLYIIFTQITGPLTERGSVKSRGQKYIDYQKQTSMFFPWFKRTIDSE